MSVQRGCWRQCRPRCRRSTRSAGHDPCRGRLGALALGFFGQLTLLLVSPVRTRLLDRGHPPVVDLCALAVFVLQDPDQHQHAWFALDSAGDHGDSNRQRFHFMIEKIVEACIEIAGLDPGLEPPIEHGRLGARRNVLEEIQTDHIFRIALAHFRFAHVVGEDAAIVVQLDDSEWHAVATLPRDAGHHVGQIDAIETE